VKKEKKHIVSTAQKKMQILLARPLPEMDKCQPLFGRIHQGLASFLLFEENWERKRFLTVRDAVREQLRVKCGIAI